MNGFEEGWKNKEGVNLTDIGFDYGVTDPKMHIALK